MAPNETGEGSAGGPSKKRTPLPNGRMQKGEGAASATTTSQPSTASKRNPDVFPSSKSLKKAKHDKNDDIRNRRKACKEKHRDDFLAYADEWINILVKDCNQVNDGRSKDRTKGKLETELKSCIKDAEKLAKSVSGDELRKIKECQEQLEAQLEDLEKGGYPGHEECLYERNMLNRLWGEIPDPRSPDGNNTKVTFRKKWESIRPRVVEFAAKLKTSDPDRSKKIADEIDDFDGKVAQLEFKAKRRIKHLVDLNLEERERILKRYERLTEMLHLMRCRFLLKEVQSPKELGDLYNEYKKLRNKTKSHKCANKQLFQDSQGKLKWEEAANVSEEVEKKLDDATAHLKAIHSAMIEYGAGSSSLSEEFSRYNDRRSYHVTSEERGNKVLKEYLAGRNLGEVEQRYQRLERDDLNHQARPKGGKGKEPLASGSIDSESDEEA